MFRVFFSIFFCWLVFFLQKKNNNLTHRLKKTEKRKRFIITFNCDLLIKLKVGRGQTPHKGGEIHNGITTSPPQKKMIYFHLLL